MCFWLWSDCGKIMIKMHFIFSFTDFCSSRCNPIKFPLQLRQPPPPFKEQTYLCTERQRAPAEAKSSLMDNLSATRPSATTAPARGTSKPPTSSAKSWDSQQLPTSTGAHASSETAWTTTGSEVESRAPATRRAFLTVPMIQLLLRSVIQQQLIWLEWNVVKIIVISLTCIQH